MRIVVLVLVWVLPLAAQTPVHVSFECSPEDAEAFGLACSEDQPCSVFLELASAAGTPGGRVFAAGNLHTSDTTLFSVLLVSDDGGATWTEPMARQRNAALEQIEFFDSQTGPQIGWISGESIDPLPRNPFLMITADGGKTWRQRLLSDDTQYGTIAQFHFTSKDDGELLLDVSQGKTRRIESYVSHTAGENWELQGVSSTVRLPGLPRQAEWRVRADAPSGTYRVEHAANSGSARVWESVANFAIHVADCR